MKSHDHHRKMPVTGVYGEKNMQLTFRVEKNFENFGSIFVDPTLLYVEYISHEFLTFVSHGCGRGSVLFCSVLKDI